MTGAEEIVPELGAGLADGAPPGVPREPLSPPRACAIAGNEINPVKARTPKTLVMTLMTAPPRPADKAHHRHVLSLSPGGPHRQAANGNPENRLARTYLMTRVGRGRFIS